MYHSACPSVLCRYRSRSYAVSGFDSPPFDSQRVGGFASPRSAWKGRSVSVERPLFVLGGCFEWLRGDMACSDMFHKKRRAVSVASRVQSHSSNDRVNRGDQNLRAERTLHWRYKSNTGNIFLLMCNQVLLMLFAPSLMSSSTNPEPSNILIPGDLLYTVFVRCCKSRRYIVVCSQ
jgi:hypothetical protein